VVEWIVASYSIGPGFETLNSEIVFVLFNDEPSVAYAQAVKHCGYEGILGSGGITPERFTCTLDGGELSA
jgi:hypothetical protein